MNWPLQKDCAAFYGNPSDQFDHAHPSTVWEAQNLVVVNAPFALTYAGKPVPHIRCHKLVANALQNVLEDIWAAAHKDQHVVDAWGMSVFGGSYNYRLMRGLDTLSMHAYGCAFDFDPSRNGLHNDIPHFASCPQVLAAWKAHGAVWGGDWMGTGKFTPGKRTDAMHWQFARVG